MGTKTQTLTYPAGTFWKTDLSPLGVAPASGQAVASVSLTRTRTGSALPNWRQKIENGESATTGLTAVWESASDTVGHAKVDYYGKTNFPNFYCGWKEESSADLRKTGTILNRGPKLPTLATTYADNQASVKFYKKLRQQAVQWSGPTFLGELREALHMVRRPAQALWSSSHGYLDAVTKAKRLDPRNWTKRLSGLWLEYSFGWTPLIKDAEDAQKAFERLLTGGNKKSVIVGSFSDERDTSASGLASNERYESWPQFGQNHWVPRYSILEERCVVRYKAKVEHETEMTRWDNWALFGFTPSELIPTAWELLPWSFLVDYFVNVGDCLNSWVTGQPKIAFVNKTVLRETKYYGALTVDAEGSRKAFSTACTRAVPSGVIEPVWNYQRKEVTRSAVSAVPLPRLQFKFDLGNGQLLNIAALLGQARLLHPQTKPRHYQATAGWKW